MPLPRTRLSLVALLDSASCGAAAMAMRCSLCYQSLALITKGHGLGPFMLTDPVRVALGESLSPIVPS
jgi:hypothetical protein